MSMAAVVYVLCALTSLTCAVLLLRAHGQRRIPLLFWSGLSFIGFALGNLFLVIDTMVMPGVDLRFFRSVPVLAGLVVLIYGLVWDSE
jgi:hypothetical protein